MAERTPDLPSWREGAARTAILDFVERVTQEGGDGYVPPRERIAVFDNDGTMWCERPIYVQAFFVLDRLREQTAGDPELAARPVVRALLSGDLKGAEAHGLEAFVEIVMRTHTGMTSEEFAEIAATWLETSRHPGQGRRFRDLTYAPMIELLDHLRTHGFRVFVVTGGGVEFVRAVSDDLYGVPADDVVGSAARLTFDRRDGRAVLVRQAAFDGSPNEGPPKAERIQQHIGRRPIVAVGNSAGDAAMLEYAETGHHPALCLVVNHDDADREYAYVGGALTDPGAESILDTAARRGWTVVSMRADWGRVFAHAG
jgi:phosphoserine phosphatase